MSKSKVSDHPAPVRVLSPEEYPSVITESRGAFRPDVKLAIDHPLGLYWVEDQGAGHLAAMFLPRRARSRMKNVGSASTIDGALRRIADHEDQLVNPDAPRESGQAFPVNVFGLGRRLSAKTPTQLDREIAEYLRTH